MAGPSGSCQARHAQLRCSGETLVAGERVTAWQPSEGILEPPASLQSTACKPHQQSGTLVCQCCCMCGRMQPWCRLCCPRKAPLRSSGAPWRDCGGMRSGATAAGHRVAAASVVCQTRYCALLWRSGVALEVCGAVCRSRRPAWLPCALGLFYGALASSRRHVRGVWAVLSNHGIAAFALWRFRATLEVCCEASWIGRAAIQVHISHAQWRGLRGMREACLCSPIVRPRTDSCHLQNDPS